jgi:hypothetical protein
MISYKPRIRDYGIDEADFLARLDAMYLNAYYWVLVTALVKNRAC